MKTLIVAVAMFSTGIAACSSSGARPDTVAYGQVASDLSAAVEAHRAATVSPTMVDCEGERGGYEERVTPMIDRMRGMSGGMDACMGSMGHNETPTMVDTCTMMRDELTRHVGAACASANPNDRIAEVNRHADRMIPWAKSEADRSARLGGMMGGSGRMSVGGCHM